MTHRRRVVTVLLALGLVLSGCGDPSSSGPTADPVTGPTGSPTASPTSSPTSAGPAATAAAAFAAFALDDVREVPWADEVLFSIARTDVARLGPTQADRPTAWRGCPAPPYGSGGVYEGRDCPVSPLRTMTIADDLGEGLVQETTAPRVVGCTRYRPPTGDADTVWLRPRPEARSCFSDFAVAVSVDGAGRVTGVDLALSGP